MTSPPRRCLLISASNYHGTGYLEHCSPFIKDFLGDKVKRVLFVPYALQDHDAYAAKARGAFEKIGYGLDSAHEFKDPADAVYKAEAMFIGGGNTFRLLKTLHELSLISVIRYQVLKKGLLYMGASAGTNVSTPNIRTTNDMPIVQPPTFEALHLVPFNINPHYLDADPNSTHKGETREERLLQFFEENDGPVLGLREGSMLRVEGKTATLKGFSKARLFRSQSDIEEFEPEADFSFLLETDDDMDDIPDTPLGAPPASSAGFEEGA